MKTRRVLPIFSIVFLCALGIAFLVNNVTSDPSSAQAASRFPTATDTKFVPKPTRTRKTPSDTPSPTATETFTPAPTNTPTNTFTPTLVPTATFTPTFTPTPTATAFPRQVRLNEILSNAEFKDWNKDGALSADDAWIELFNLGDHPADVSGWKIDTGLDTPFFLIPKDTLIPPGGFVIFFHNQTLLDLQAYNDLRLIFPDGSLSDEVRYPSLDSDRVYARLHDGVDPWRLGCVPTPLGHNCQQAETVTSQFNLPYFKQSIAAPNKNYDVQVVVTNFLLAVILALAIGFFSNLLNDAVESHEEDLSRRFAPILTPVNKIRETAQSLNRIVNRSRNQWLEFSLKFLIILIIYGGILAYLDPSFQFINQDGFLLILALGLSTGFIALIDDLATYVYLRIKGAGGDVRLHSTNLLAAILSTLFSRVTRIVPGLLLGSPAGIEDVPSEYSGPHLDVLAILVTAGAALAAWALEPMFQNDPWLSTLLLLTFAAGVQTVFFEMLPVSYLRGKGIFELNKLLWLVLFIGATALFLQTMLNPDGAFLSAFESTNMLMLSAFVAIYCVVCAVIWFILTQADRRKESVGETKSAEKEG